MTTAHVLVRSATRLVVIMIGLDFFIAEWFCPR
jgi:hypothetical protein